MAACDCDCGASASLEPPPPQYALLFHLLLSFVLAAYVRWHKLDVHRPKTQVPDEDKPRKVLQAPVPSQGDASEIRTPTESTTNATTTISTPPSMDEIEAQPPVSTGATGTRATQGSGEEQGEEDERVATLRRANAKYLTMLKVGMPRSIVEHKMRMEGADVSVLDLLLGPTASTTAARHQPMMAMASSILRPPPIIIPPPPPADAIASMAESLSGKYAAFKQMVKVGVPRHVVEHKMKSEGLDPAGLDRDHSSSAGTASSPRSVSSAASTAPSSPDSSSSSSAMTTVGFHQASLARAVIRKMQSNMRKKLHWTTTALVDAPPTSQRRDSLWSRVHVRAKANRVSISTETIQWMEKLFVKAVIAGKKARSQRRRRTASTVSQSELSRDALAACEADDAQLSDDELDQVTEETQDAKKNPATAFLARKVYVTLLDRNKSQNIAIVLARVKRTFPELVREVSVLNPDVLSTSALQTLLDMWPDCNEQAALDAFNGDVTSLATAEQFLLEAQKLPRVQQKLRCLRFKADFFPRVEELRESMDLVIRGVSQVISSDAFALVLEYIYHLGNLLNFGDGVEYTAKVKSISISSLSKLSFTKAYDGRVSFLQYLVQSIERDAPHLARFGDEIDLISKCSRVSVPNVLAELSALKGGVRMLENEAKQPMPPVLTALPADDPERTAFELSKQTLHGDAMTLGQEINALGELSDQLDRQRKRFLDYFEEDAALPLDELLGFIATFVAEYSHERAQLLRRSVSHQTSANNSNSSNNSITSRPYMVEVLKRHSL